MPASPSLRSVVVDTTAPRRAAELYRELLGWEYRPGDEPPPEGAPDPRGSDWLVLRPPGGGVGIAFSAVDDLARSTWPRPEVPQQLHLDLGVSTLEELHAARDRALELGASLLHDRSADDQEPLYVFADLDGHPFCIFVAHG